VVQTSANVPGAGAAAPPPAGEAAAALPNMRESAPSPPETKRPEAPAPSPARSFLQSLVESEVIASHQASDARQVALAERISIGQVLVRDGVVSARNLATLMALYLQTPMMDLQSQVINRDAMVMLPEHLARRYIALPIEKKGDRLVVAMADPTDFPTLHHLTISTGCAIEPVIALAGDILEHIDLLYRQVAVQQDAHSASREGEGTKVTARLLKDSPVTQVIELLLERALHDRASDIHIEVADERLKIRFRIDGILTDAMTLPLEMHPILVSRLKIMAGLNIAERRRPQDGQFTTEFQDRKVDVRVAISNTVSGEMAVLRLLDKKFTLRGLDVLGMRQEDLERYRKLLRLPYGMVIICGPTGAGKSTSLYASVLEMNRKEQNVISLEDPVEYRIQDTNQMQIHVEAGVTFASQLRSILRLDPDVILVGEIRDQETAVIATQASLTGHLVLTSLHANDAVSALIRLRDLGVPSYLLASSVAGIVSQRMVRVVCDSCKTLMVRPQAERETYAAELGEVRKDFLYGSGCNLCAHTGYRGRVGVFEVLTMTDRLRHLFLSNSSRSEMRWQALEDGMVPLLRDGMVKVKQGVTTPYEVMRVLFTLDQ